MSAAARASASRSSRSSSAKIVIRPISSAVTMVATVRHGPAEGQGSRSSSLFRMAAPVQRDQELELTVESLAFGGNGVARLDGFVVFVRRGLPGDTVRARVTKVQRRHAEAVATEVLVAGPQRVEAPCAHYPACGGCRFQDLALRRAARREGAVGRGFAAAARRARRPSARADRPCRVAVRLPQQDGVFVRAIGRQDRRSGCTGPDAGTRCSRSSAAG